MKFIFISIFMMFSISYANNDTIMSLQHRIIKTNYIKLGRTSNARFIENKNLIKLSLPLLNQPSLSLQYERNFYKKFTIGTSINYTPKQDFLFFKTIANQKISNEFVKHQLSNIKTSIFSISPEIKMYLGKEAFKGFYIAPFIHFSNYNVDFPLQYIESELQKHYQEVSFSGKFKTFTYGVSFGAQWNVYKNFYVDWLIVGPHIGKSQERFVLDSDLSTSQQKGIKKSLDLIKTIIEETEGVPNINFDYTVNEKGSEIKIRNPWAGVRLQLGVGYRF